MELLQKTLHDPHDFLGVHPKEESGATWRIFRADQQALTVEIDGVQKEVQGESGLFEIDLERFNAPYELRIADSSGLFYNDPYTFLPTINGTDEHLFGGGVHYEIHKKMGANRIIHQGVEGVAFALWAPCAKQVALIGDFNEWNADVHPMRRMGVSGIWELFLPGLEEGVKYQFQIEAESGETIVKSDPYAKAYEVRPEHRSKVFGSHYSWEDQEWMAKRVGWDYNRSPMNIYEVHLGSWRRKEGEFLNYREMATQLAPYVKEMGYTHVELMPILEHPLDESWGYQVTGYFAPTSRFGTPDDFRFLVDHLHKNGIGVILDWVPAHFPTDSHGLAHFDGSALYEHLDPKEGFHPHWKTHIFNYGRFEVSNFLLGSALFWLEEMHIDGLRVDAVMSMLYRDYGREPGKWTPNHKGGRENLEAIEFLKHLNSIVHQRVDGALMIAEDASAFPGVTKSLDEGGLGFDLKWNMGWMNDSLEFACEPVLGIDKLKRIFSYSFDENYCLPLSHDEVVHEKSSLVSKMPGNETERFALMRSYLTYQICHPGKKLLFMGGEFAVFNEWDPGEELPWYLLKLFQNLHLHRFVKQLNYFYLENRALWHEEQFQIEEGSKGLLSFSRGELLILINFTEKEVADIPMEREILLHSDQKEFGGTGKTVIKKKKITLSPYTAAICR
ncbi:MAG: 1,4-alpha-glucan branching protein GlgB [Candidatus Algichlamydia australiensis]|nr:1,4-alpha-glucan branching protein GlgB [Chlamydiales bacterium]